MSIAQNNEHKYTYSEQPMAINLRSRRSGRPTVLTDQVAQILIDSVSKGNYISVACQSAGIDKSTYNNWMKWAKDVQDYLEDNNITINPDDIDNNNNILDIIPTEITDQYTRDKLVYWYLMTELKTAEAKAIETLHNRIVEAGKSGPQYWIANMTLLERRHPDLYGKREAVDVNVREGQELLVRIKDNLLQCGKDTAQLPAPRS